MAVFILNSTIKHFYMYERKYSWMYVWFLLVYDHRHCLCAKNIYQDLAVMFVFLESYKDVIFIWENVILNLCRHLCQVVWKFIMHVITLSHKKIDSSKHEALRFTDEKPTWLILMCSQLPLPYHLKLRDWNVGNHRQFWHFCDYFS